VPQDYDVTLKMLLREPAERAVHAVTGLSVERWLDAELPKIQNPRMDLLGEVADGSLLHLELQTGNDSDMPQRMAEYALGIHRIFRKFPRQIVLYAGEPDLRMRSSLEGPRFSFSYEVIDLREMDGERLLASNQVGDNVLAILTRLRDQRGAIDEIVRKIAGLQETQRERALQQLFVLAGLRGLEEAVEEGIRRMPTLNEIILNNKVLGREYKRGLAEGELRVVRRLAEKRFGAIPRWAEERLGSCSAEELEALSVRVLDAQSLEELLN
jgi:hypothetical protein